MSIYILNYLSLLLWSFLQNKRCVAVLVGIQLFLILALRSDTLGVDLDKYFEAYVFYQKYSFIEIINSLRLFVYADLPIGVESGYVFVSWLCGFLGLSFHSFLVIHALVCVLSLSFFVYKYSRMPWLSFAILIAIGTYSYMFCILRQTFAVAILFQTFPLIQRKMLKSFLLLVLLASCFHIVALLFLPLYWLSNVKIEWKSLTIGIIVSLFVSLMTPVVYNRLLVNIFTSVDKGYELGEKVAYNNMMLFMVFVICFLYFFFRNQIKYDEKEIVLFWCAFLAIPVQSMSFLIPIFSRAAIGIFLPVIAILIPNEMDKNPDLYGHIFPKIAVFIFFFLYFLLTFSSGGLNLIPYKMIDF